MTKQPDHICRLVWISPIGDDQGKRMELTGPREACLQGMSDLLEAGILMVAVYDEAYAQICDAERAEERLMNPITIGEAVAGDLLAETSNEMLSRLFKPRKSG